MKLTRELSIVLFLLLLFSSPAILSAQASSGDECIIALNPSASGALNLNGSIVLNAGSCGVVDNSTSSSGLSSSGSGIITTKYLDVAGGYSSSGSFIFTPNPTLYSSPMADP